MISWVERLDRIRAWKSKSLPVVLVLGRKSFCEEASALESLQSDLDEFSRILLTFDTDSLPVLDDPLIDHEQLEYLGAFD